MTIISREEHNWIGIHPETGKPVDLKCWMYTFQTISTEQKVVCYSFDTHDVGTWVIAWVEIRRQKDENHVPRSYNIVDRFQEIRGGVITDPLHLRDRSFEKKLH